MDTPGFEPLTLSIGLMIDWHINPLSHHGSVTLFLFANIQEKIVYFKPLKVKKSDTLVS